MDTTRFCVDCKWYRPFKEGIPTKNTQARYAKCAQPEVQKAMYYVDGRPDTFCSVQRDFRGPKYCGPEGRFWEESERTPGDVVVVEAPKKSLGERFVDFCRGYWGGV